MPSLLVITPGFPQIQSHRYRCQFVFAMTQLAMASFSQIDVISPQPFFPFFLRRFSFFETYAQFTNFVPYQIGKIKVTYPTFWTFPFSFFRNRQHLFFSRAMQSTLQPKKHLYDVCHVHFLYPAGQAVQSFQKNPARHQILSLHGGDVYEWSKNKQHRLVIPAIFASFDLITVPSQYLFDLTVKLSPKIISKLRIMPHAVDTTLFKFRSQSLSRRKLGLPANSKILIYVANLVKGKGHLDLLKAFKLLANHDSSLQLYLIGEGEQKKALREFVRRYQLETQVTFVGGVNHLHLPTWYSAADLFVFPSYYESFGIVQIEALACGLPVVAYDNPASQELLSSNPKLGILSKRGQPRLLAKNVRVALQKNWDSEVMRKFVVKNFSQKNAQQKWTKVYQRLLKK